MGITEVPGPAGIGATLVTILIFLVLCVGCPGGMIGLSIKFPVDNHARK